MEKTVFIFIIILALVFLFSCEKNSSSQINKISGITNPLRIAHAGGGLNGLTYTNSYEALDYNIQQGFTYFELDFSYTKDGKIVCLHDWKHSFKQAFGFETKKKITLKKFKELSKKSSSYKTCTLDGLAIWMKQNPTAIIITDVKRKNYKALKIIFNTLPDAKRRVIPQIYKPENFNKIKKLGYEQIIWTLYRYRKSNEKVVTAIKEFYGPIAITMPRNRAESTLPKIFKSMGVPTYVHTINNRDEQKGYTQIYGITEIYTDILTPFSENISENKLLE